MCRKPSPRSIENIDFSFDQRSLQEDDLKIFHEIKGEIKRVSFLINNNLPDGRGKSIALTRLEEATMWAYESIKFNCLETGKYPKE